MHEDIKLDRYEMIIVVMTIMVMVVMTMITMMMMMIDRYVDKQ